MSKTPPPPHRKDTDMYTINGYLYHHGIQGQKWGVRNGPPYPLSANAHSAAEKKAMKGGTKKQTASNKQGLSPEAAEAIISLSITLAPLAITAVASLVAKGMMHADTKKAQKKLDQMRSERKSNIDEKSGLPKKKKETTPEQDLKHVNPLHDNKTMAVNQNCVYCTVAYEMRRRGYDVNANLSEKPLPGFEMYKEMFPGSKQDILKTPTCTFLDPKSTASDLKLDRKKTKELNTACNKAMVGENREHAKTIISEMSKQPDSRGAMAIIWGVGGGHMVAYEVKNGEFMIRDGQSGETYKGKELEDLLSLTIISTYSRLDNVKVDYEKIKEACG